MAWQDRRDICSAQLAAHRARNWLISSTIARPGRALRSGVTSTLSELRAELKDATIVSVEGATIEGVASYESELEHASSAEPARPGLSDDDALCTSTPPAPRATERRDHSASPSVVELHQHRYQLGLRETDVSPLLTPMFHSGGLFAFLAPIFYAGGKIILTRTFDAAQSLKIFVEEKCTVILGVPTLYQMWLAAPNIAQLDFSHVRYFINGGGRCQCRYIKRGSKLSAACCARIRSHRSRRQLFQHDR